MLSLEQGATSASFTGNILNQEDTDGAFNLRAYSGGTLTIAGPISTDTPGGGGVDIIGDGNVSTADGTVVFTGTNTYTDRTRIAEQATLQTGDGIGGRCSGAVRTMPSKRWRRRPWR